MTADTRLAVYGSLAPGQSNHHQLAGLEGTWRAGTVTGTLADNGWGAALGYPALTLDSEGTAIPVQLFEPADLPAHWSRLDAFEGADYRRAVAQVTTATGVVDAWIYVGAPAG